MYIFIILASYFAGEPSTVATPSSQTSTAVSATPNQDGSQPSTSATATVLPEQGTSLSQDDQNISSILEATHESLIPLEEDPHDLEELVADEDMEHHQLLSEVAHLARELGRVDQVDFVNDIIEEAMESVAEGVGVGGDSGEEGGELGIGMEDASMEDSDLASVSDDEDDEDDDEIYEDNCNSAGEEVLMAVLLAVLHTFCCVYSNGMQAKKIKQFHLSPDFLVKVVIRSIKVHYEKA